MRNMKRTRELTAYYRHQRRLEPVRARYLLAKARRAVARMEAQRKQEAA